MNKLNLLKQIAAFSVLIAAMITFSTVNDNLYRTVVYLIGCWQLGSWGGAIASRYWPILNKKTE